MQRFSNWLKFNTKILFNIFCFNFRVHLGKKDFFSFLLFCLALAVAFELVVLVLVGILNNFYFNYYPVLFSSVFIFLPLLSAIHFAIFYASSGFFRVIFGIYIFLHFYEAFINLAIGKMLLDEVELIKPVVYFLSFADYLLKILFIIGVIFIFFSKKTSEISPLFAKEIIFRILFISLNLLIIFMSFKRDFIFALMNQINLQTIFLSLFALIITIIFKRAKKC